MPPLKNHFGMPVWAPLGMPQTRLWIRSSLGAHPFPSEDNKAYRHSLETVQVQFQTAAVRHDVFGFPVYIKVVYMVL